MCFTCTALRFKNHRLVGKIRTMEHFEIAAHVNSVLRLGPSIEVDEMRCVLRHATSTQSATIDFPQQ